MEYDLSCSLHYRENTLFHFLWALIMSSCLFTDEVHSNSESLASQMDFQLMSKTSRLHHRLKVCFYLSAIPGRNPCQ